MSTSRLLAKVSLVSTLGAFALLIAGGVLGGVVLGGSVLAGCGGASTRADVDPAPMPEGGTFTGVWHSPQYGTLQMRQTGTAVIGEYEKDERVGTIQGTAEGNLLRFQWTERRELIQGRASETTGRGYFQLTRGQDGDYYVLGEWGHDDSELGGGGWRAVRSRTGRVHLSTDSSGGEQGGGTSGGSEYDEYGEGNEGGDSSDQGESTPPPAQGDGLEGMDL